MSSLYEYIGNKIKELRISYGGSGIRQDELADYLDTSANTISRWETATYKPSINELDRLAKFFGVSISIFFPGETESDSKLKTLMSATGGLKDDDFEDLIEYAKFRKARRTLESNKNKGGK